MVRDNRRAQGNSAPLLEALEDYARHERLGFHMPGHQQGLGLPPAFTRLLTSYGAAFDLTELPGLDHLAAPSGSIEKSQKAMADSAGSVSAYYLVNGSTGGLEAAMLAMSGPDTVTVMPNCCHSAVYNGLVLTGSMPVILPSLVDPQWGLPLGLDKKAAESFIKQDTGAMGKALWVSLNPTYHGVMADLAWEKKVLGKKPAWGWLVDEAHGAHLPYLKSPDGKGRSLSAISYAAHVVVQSTHKMGTGLTQTGILHCNRTELSSKLRQAVNLLQSSSPSYLLMASMDAWQAFLSDKGEQELVRLEELADGLAGQIRAIGGYRLWRDEAPAGYTIDPRKMTLSSKELGLSGFALAEILRMEYGIDAEWAARDHVLFIINIGHSEDDAERLAIALKNIQGNKNRAISTMESERGCEEKAGEGDEKEALIASLYHPGIQQGQPAITPREAFFRERQRVKLEQAPGRLAAVAVAPYPPGIPLVFPGMEITKETVEAIGLCHKTGLPCTGLEESGGVLSIEVI